MAGPTFQPGFRLSIVDVIFLVLTGASSAYVASIDRWAGLAIAFVVLHFFLFCNVLRMARLLELIWAGAFGVLAVVAATSNLLSWPATFALSAVVTFVVAAVEVRKPSYHGAGWKRLNPELPAWWNASVTRDASGRR